MTILEVLPRETTGVLLPSLIAEAGENAGRRFLDFFFVTIRNPNTRAAYAHATGQFLSWCEARGVSLEKIEPMIVAAYIEQHPAGAPTVKQHLAALKMLFDHLVTGRVLASNPAASVRGPKHVVKKGKTPVLSAEEARELISAIGGGSLTRLRDRAIVSVMTYSFARVSAVIGMRVGDYFQQGRRSWFRLHEKGGRFHEVPAHHKAEGYLDEYIEAAGLKDQPKVALFQSTGGRSARLSGVAMSRRDVLAMVKRRAAESGLPPHVCNHSFRATGITVYLKGGGTLEKAAYIAGHASTQTTKLYDRRDDEISLDEIERIRL